MAEIRGLITAMATPFDESGAVDEGAARALARHLIENGSHGVVVAGTTGECPTLDDAEHISLLRAVVDEIGAEATIVCGTGTNDTRHSRDLTAAAVEAGTDAVLVVTPYYNKPNEAGIKAHFEAVADAAGETPVIAYNIPSRCVVNISPGLLAEMAAEIAAAAPLAVRATKRMMRAGLTESFEDHVPRVFNQLVPLTQTKDFAEGMNSFLEKRPPNFEGK